MGAVHHARPAVERRGQARRVSAWLGRALNGGGEGRGERGDARPDRRLASAPDSRSSSCAPARLGPPHLLDCHACLDGFTNPPICSAVVAFLRQNIYPPDLLRFIYLLLRSVTVCCYVHICAPLPTLIHVRYLLRVSVVPVCLCHEDISSPATKLCFTRPVTAAPDGFLERVEAGAPLC